MDHLNGAERHARHRRSGLRGAMLPPNCCCQRSAACCRLPTAKSIASSSGGISHLQFYQRSCANALLPSALAAASVSAASFSRLVPAAPARADRTRGPTSSASAASTPCGTTSVGRRRAPRGAPRSTTEHHRRYFITSLLARVASFAHAVRSHSQFENACHWTLKVVFNEVQHRARRNAGPATIATFVAGR